MRLRIKCFSGNTSSQVLLNCLLSKVMLVKPLTISAEVFSGAPSTQVMLFSACKKCKNIGQQCIVFVETTNTGPPTSGAVV